MAPALMMTTPAWKSTTDVETGWETVAFNDSSWKHVQTLGGIESTLDLFQWNADAGLYDWPGFDGISPFLAHRRVAAQALLSMTQASSRLENVTQLTKTTPSADFVVRLSAPNLPTQQAPSIILDFGKELTGRLEMVSNSTSTAQVTIQYGESYDEMLKNPYLGVNLLNIAPHATAHGPNTSFRYVKVAFIGGGPELLPGRIQRLVRVI
jgi:hypothetical protein